MILKEVKANTTYEITVTETAEERAKRQAMLCRIITELELEDEVKCSLYAQLREAESKEDYKEIVVQSELPKIHQLRLLEIIA